MKHLRYLLLAALVAMPLTACNEDANPVATIYGTIQGTVAAEGTGLAGIVVNISGANNYSATTGAGGTYTIANVEAGSYSAAIIAPPGLDVVFGTSTQLLTVETSGQVLTVDFAGSFIRTASISGTVASGATPLAGVKVVISGGPDVVSISKDTDLGGGYSASGLRKGTYTVTISNTPANVEFVNKVKTVTVDVGEAGSATFIGIPKEMSTISGVVLVDNVGQAGVPVALTGAASATTETALGGAFSFTNLAPGVYTVTITPPEGVEFPATSKGVTVGLGQTGVVNFIGVGPKEPSTISIQSITKGGQAVDLTNVYGQIEITLNITRNDQTLDYVDVLIGDVVVATQDFANAVAEAEMAGGQETVTLNVPTTQVWLAENGWTPAVWNGGNTISANLYVVEGGQPIPTNKVPVVMQNEDRLLPGFSIGGDLEFTPDEPLRTATGPGTSTKVWYAGLATFTGPQFLSYSTIVPDTIVFDVDPDCDLDSESTTGDAATGIAVTNTFECLEGTYEPDWNDFWVHYPTYVGPDGTAVDYDEDMAAIGAEFFLSDGTVGPRRFVIMDPQEGQIEDSNSLNMDNKAPTVTLALPVAFNDNFSQFWVKGDYNFLTKDVTSSDGGVGGIVEKAFLWNWDFDYPDEWEYGDDCTTVMVTTPDGANGGSVMAETLTSDDAETGDSYAICGYAEDALGNGAYTAHSNSFGVDKVAPQVRIWGDDSSDAIAGGLAAPIGDSGPDSLGTAISPNLNETVFGTADMMGTGNYHYAAMDEMYWGLDGIDDRSGFDSYTGYPFYQRIIRKGAVTPADTVMGTSSAAVAALSDNWRRVSSGTDFLGEIGDMGIFTYEGYVTDRAGNKSAMFFYNWLVDNLNGPETTAITPTTTSFTIGQPAMFNVWGSDDLEITQLGFKMLYPTPLGVDIDLFYGSQMVAADRWDAVFKNTLSGAQYGTSTVWGRIDFTDAVGAVPGTMVYLDSLQALPTEVGVLMSEDAGYNPGASDDARWTFISYAFGGWHGPIMSPWPNANIDFFTIEDEGTKYVVEHVGSSSVDAFIMDQVLLAVFDGNAVPNPTISVCASKAGTDHVYTDNGTNRFYTYTFAYPTTGPCAAANIAEGASIHAVGVKGNALLGTNDFTIVPNPIVVPPPTD